MYGDLGMMNGGEVPSVAGAAGISNPLSSGGGLWGAAFDPLYSQRAALLAGQHIMPAPASTGYIPPNQFRSDAMSRLMTQHNDVTSNFTSVGGQQFITVVVCPNRCYSPMQPCLHSNAPPPAISALNTAAGTIPAMDFAPSAVTQQQRIQRQGKISSSQPQSSSQKHRRDSDVDPAQPAKTNKRQNVSREATRVVQRKALQKIDESQVQDNDDDAGEYEQRERDLHDLMRLMDEHQVLIFALACCLSVNSWRDRYDFAPRTLVTLQGKRKTRPLLSLRRVAS